MGEGLVVAHSLRYSQSTMVGKSKQQKLEAAGHVASTVRREQCIHYTVWVTMLSLCIG